MITLTRTSEPEAKVDLFTIERDGEKSLRLTRSEAVARLDKLKIDNAEKRVDQAVLYRVIVIHQPG